MTTPDAAVLKEISSNLADVVAAGSGPVRRVSVAVGVVSVDVEWEVSAAGAVAAVSVPVAEPVGESATAHCVRAPLVGTFYHAPEPGAAPFVRAGEPVAVGQQVGIVEAMKLMNPVESDCAGVVVEITVGNGEPVEYDQPLLLVEPAEGQE